MKKTFLELLQVDGVVGALYKANPELRESKFGYAYNKFYKDNIQPTSELLAEEINLARIDNALEDEKTKAIIRDEKSPRGYAYSKEGEKAVIAAEKTISQKFEQKEIEIKPYISSYIPEMTEEQKELLKGLVI